MEHALAGRPDFGGELFAGPVPRRGCEEQTPDDGNQDVDRDRAGRQDGGARPRANGRPAFVFARIESAPRRGEKRNPGKKPSHGDSAKEKDPQAARREAEALRGGVPAAAPEGGGGGFGCGSHGLKGLQGLKGLKRLKGGFTLQ